MEIHAGHSCISLYQMVTKIIPSRCKDYIIAFCLDYPYINITSSSQKII